MAPMFHSNTELLIDRWRALSFSGAAPARTDLDPAEFSRVIPQVFIAGREEPGFYPIRLAGEFLRDIHDRDLRGENIMGLWNVHSRLELRSALEAARRNPAPIVVTAEARAADGRYCALEVFFAPLTGPTGEADRFLGLYQPTTPIARLLGAPVRELIVKSIAGADAEDAPRLRLASLDGRRIA